MANPQLTADQLQGANALLAEIRARLTEIAGTDEAFWWALRRKVAKELIYDERGKPSHCRALKAAQRKRQLGIFPECIEQLPETYCVLDRKEGLLGYTMENTRLLCQPCDHRIQRERGFA